MDKPATAYQLLNEVAKRYTRSVQPASIYRSLDALMTLGVVAKIETVNAFTVCKHPHHDHQHVFLVCDNCGRIDEIADQGISGQLQKGAESHGFKPSRQILELHGDCKACQK
jgi:Fur family zinc uptake transcriptional regulator